MARRPSTFRERDLRSALKVAQGRGLSIVRIEITQDGLILVPGKPGPTDAAADNPNPNEMSQGTKNALAAQRPRRRRNCAD